MLTESIITGAAATVQYSGVWAALYTVQVQGGGALETIILDSRKSYIVSSKGHMIHNSSVNT